MFVCLCVFVVLRVCVVVFRFCLFCLVCGVVRVFCLMCWAFFDLSICARLRVWLPCLCVSVFLY